MKVKAGPGVTQCRQLASLSEMATCSTVFREPDERNGTNIRVNMKFTSEIVLVQ